jgi:hypothetical protein
MRSAMPRFLTVNGFSASPPVPQGSQDVNFDPDANSAPEFGVKASNPGVESGGYATAQTADGVSAGAYGIASTIRKNSGDQGPCLYFGPQGQRCDRPAIANGFCRRHLPAQLSQSARFGPTSSPQLGRSTQPTAAPRDSKPFARVIAVGIAIFAALWPVIADLLREIFRWINKH